MTTEEKLYYGMAVSFFVVAVTLAGYIAIRSLLTRPGEMSGIQALLAGWPLTVIVATSVVLLVLSLFDLLAAAHPFAANRVSRMRRRAIAHLRDLLMRPRGYRFLSVAKGDQQHCEVFWDYKAQPTEYIFEARVPEESGVWGPGWIHLYNRRLVNEKLVPYLENGVLATAYIEGPVKWERYSPAETGGGKR